MKDASIRKEESMRSEYLSNGVGEGRVPSSTPGKDQLLDAAWVRYPHNSFNRPVESVGIDISEEELARNTAITERIHGISKRTRPLRHLMPLFAGMYLNTFQNR
jgi:hypothetical protein